MTKQEIEDEYWLEFMQFWSDNYTWSTRPDKASFWMWIAKKKVPSMSVVRTDKTIMQVGGNGWDML